MNSKNFKCVYKKLEECNKLLLDELIITANRNITTQNSMDFLAAVDTIRTKFPDKNLVDILSPDAYQKTKTFSYLKTRLAAFSDVERFAFECKFDGFTTYMACNIVLELWNSGRQMNDIELLQVYDSLNHKIPFFVVMKKYINYCNLTDHYLREYNL